MNIFLLIVLGSVGVLARYFLAWLLPSEPFSWSVLTVNVVGSFFVGVFMNQKFMPPQVDASLHLAVIFGLLGGLTTFSSYSADAVRLIHESKWLVLAIVVLLNNALSIAACFIGHKIVT